LIVSVPGHRYNAEDALDYAFWPAEATLLFLFVQFPFGEDGMKSTAPFLTARWCAALFVAWCSLCLSLQTGWAGDDPDEPAGDTSAHQTISQYAKAIAALNEEYQLHLKDREKLSGEFRELYNRFSAAGAEAQAIDAQANIEFKAWLMAYTQSTQDRQSLAAIPRQSGPQGMRPAARATEFRALQSQTVELNQGQRVAQMQLAQNISGQRLQRLQQELAQLGVKAQSWMQADMQSVHEYALQADVSNTRSDLELKSAKRLLQTELESTPQNTGAKLALAITLMRLDERDEARGLLDALVDEGGSAVLLAKAARSELLAQLGDHQLAKKDLSAVKNFKLPESLHLQARAYALIGEPRQAESLWQALAKTSEYEVVARCQLASQLITSRTSAAKAKRAIAEAQLAMDLSGNDDWYCHLTSAVCLAAGGQKDAAIAAGDLAAELAIGNKQTLCHEICDKIKLDKSVAWAP
jgi:hypothetical protein